MIAAVALVAVVGAVIAMARTSASAPPAQAPAVVAVRETIAPATTPTTMATVAQGATAAPSKTYSFGGNQHTLDMAQDGVVRLPAADLDVSKARFYAFQGNGKTIPFFVLKSADGIIRAAFNACDVCYLGLRGYRQEGDEMVCNNCGSRFPSARINEESGGCNPAPLVRTVQGGDILIKAADLEAGAKYF